MDKVSQPLAVTLRWMAILWLLGWTLYATVWDQSSSYYLRDTIVELGALLIPAAIAFGVSWCLDRFAAPQRHGPVV